MTTIEKLAALQNRGTLYELELANLETGERRLIAYTRNTKTRGIAAMMRQTDAVIAVIGRVDLFASKRAEKSFIAYTRDGKWVARFTGRTQRDAICNGELQPVTP